MPKAQSKKISKNPKSDAVKIETIRHSLAHILAMAVSNLFPGVKLGMGPSIENGFYYDFDFGKNKSISPNDLLKIEQEMKKTIKKGVVFRKKTFAKTETEKIFKDQAYKLEILKDIPGKNATLYESNGFIDLCEGPHISIAKEIEPGSFKLIKIAGAYFKGDEKRNMLTRIYGLAFKTSKELSSFINLQEEAEKRDHRKLGKALDLFYFSDLVGPGLPLFAPRGTIIKEELQKRVEEICRSYGFQKVITPHLAKPELFELSGHTKKFGEELFRVSSPRGHKFALKPVQCPHQTQIYASKPRSYKELPIRYMESEKQYRAEKPGEVGGLNRVYAITVEDGHSFCAIWQVKKEIKILVKIIRDFYKSLGLWGNHWVSLSVRDYKSPEKYIGEKKDWDICEKILKEVCEEMKLGAKVCKGEAAHYGPKIDFMFRDSLGKEVQIPTVQIDFATPKRFNLSYINKKGEKEPPVMVHRAILGSYERFLALLIEHYAGAFPVWLAPVQARVLTVGKSFQKYANEIYSALKTAGIRAEIDNENLTLGKKIREAETMKIPYIIVVGEKEEKSKTVNVRVRKKPMPSSPPQAKRKARPISETMKINDFILKIKKEIEGKK